MDGGSRRAPVFIVVGSIVLLLLAALSYASLNAKKAATNASTSGFGNPIPVQQTTPPQGAPVGGPRPGPSQLKAKPVVVPPPPSWPPLQPPPPGTPISDINVSVSPGRVDTIARLDDTQGSLGGVTVVGDTAYVLTGDGVRAVDLKSGSSHEVAGIAGDAGCSMGAASEVRLSGPPGDLVTDEKSLYAGDACGIVKIEIKTGAASQLTTWSGPMTLGPDDHLYVGASEDGHPVVARVDTGTGTPERYLSLPDGSSVLGLAADSSNLWAVIDEGPSSPAVLDQIEFESGSVARFADPTFDIAGAGQLVSAGDYLYAPSVTNQSVLAFGKRTGAWGIDVGGDTGDVDGAGTIASFGAVRGLASDGRSAIWVTDPPNGSLRRVTFATMPSGAMTGV